MELVMLHLWCGNYMRGCSHMFSSFPISDSFHYQNNCNIKIQFRDRNVGNCCLKTSLAAKMKERRCLTEIILSFLPFQCGFTPVEWDAATSGAHVQIEVKCFACLGICGLSVQTQPLWQVPFVFHSWSLPPASTTPGLWWNHSARLVDILGD